MQIILASRSPRRAGLLKKIISDFEIIPSSVNEEKIKEKDPIKFALQAAELKAKDVGTRHPQAIVIGADTIVVLEGKIFGKPKDPEDAKKILKMLSGKTHQVISGIAVYKKDESKLISAYESTDVAFKVLSDKEIEDYIKKETVHDKAGSYAIQDIGDRFIKGIKGDYDNVVGLPVNLVKKLLKSFRSCLQ